MHDKIVSDDPSKLKYCHDRYKTQEMCNKAVQDFLPALKFVPDWFVTSKMIKNFLLLYIQMILYSILINILVMPYFIVIKWVFLV